MIGKRYKNLNECYIKNAIRWIIKFLSFNQIIMSNLNQFKLLTPYWILHFLKYRYFKEFVKGIKY